MLFLNDEGRSTLLSVLTRGFTCRGSSLGCATAVLYAFSSFPKTRMREEVQSSEPPMSQRDGKNAVFDNTHLLAN